MEKRLFLLLGSFIALYYLIRVGYDMPNLVHGNPLFIWWPRSLVGWWARCRDIAFYFLFTLIPYLVLFRWYPAKRMLLVVGLILTGLPLLFLLRYWVEADWLGRGGRLKTYFENTLFYVLIFSVYGAGFYFIRYSRYKEIQQKDLEIQNRQSELSFLRSQINPHFLFNNLNNIYSLVYQGSAQALTAIAGLSELLRYMLYDTTEKVSLQKEMDYIRKYIDLQKLRFDHPIKVEIQVEEAGVRVTQGAGPPAEEAAAEIVGSSGGSGTDVAGVGVAKTSLAGTSVASISHTGTSVASISHTGTSVAGISHTSTSVAGTSLAGTIIPPLLLIPFVENAFKHGDLSETGQGLKILIFNSPQKTYFHAHNSKGPGQKDAGGGIGLENVRRRLALLYPGRHSLLIEEDTGQFTVKLELTHE